MGVSSSKRKKSINHPPPLHSLGNHRTILEEKRQHLSEGNQQLIEKKTKFNVNAQQEANTIANYAHTESTCTNKKENLAEYTAQCNETIEARSIYSDVREELERSVDETINNCRDNVTQEVRVICRDVRKELDSSAEEAVNNSRDNLALEAGLICRDVRKELESSAEETVNNSRDNLALEAGLICRDVRKELESSAEETVNNSRDNVALEAGLICTDVREELESSAEETLNTCRDKLTMEAGKICSRTREETNRMTESALHKSREVLATEASEICKAFRQETNLVVENAVTYMTEIAESTDREGRVCSHAEVYNQMKIEFRKDLVNLYKESQSSIAVSPLLPEVDAKVENLYVSPNIHTLNSASSVSGSMHANGKQTIETIKCYRDLFYTDNISVRNIYVQGEPGTGKSSFCTNMTTEWSVMKAHQGSCLCNLNNSSVTKGIQQNKTSGQNDSLFTDTSVLDEFDFLFIISLRDARGHDCEIDEMIKNQIIACLARANNYDTKFLETILNDERCLIILDGLDEWKHPEDKDQLCRRLNANRTIPHRKVRENCTILTTTRPWKMTEVAIKSSETNKILAITGVSNIEALVKNVMECLGTENGHNMSPKSLIKYIESKELKPFLSIPIILMQLLCLWYERMDLGTSRCDIYRNMIWMLFKRNDINNNDIQQNECTMHFNAKDGTSCLINLDLLHALGCLAFYGLLNVDMESTIVFSADFVHSFLTPEQCKRALQTGLLSQHRIAGRLTDHQSTYCFLHKTFQEYFAALYISSDVNDFSNILELISRVCKSVDDFLNLSEMFTFTCALNSEIAVAISKLIMERLDSEIVASNVGRGKNPKTGSENSIRRVQTMILNGYREGIANGQPDLELALHHAVIVVGINYGSGDDNRSHLRQLIELKDNKRNLLTCEIYGGSEELSSISCLLKSLQSIRRIRFRQYNQRELDLSNSRDLESLYIERCSFSDIRMNTNMAFECTICEVDSSTTELLLKTLLKSVPNMQCLQMGFVHGSLRMDIDLNFIYLKVLKCSKIDINGCLNLGGCPFLKSIYFQFCSAERVVFKAVHLRECVIQGLDMSLYDNFLSTLAVEGRKLKRLEIDSFMCNNIAQLVCTLPALEELHHFEVASCSDVRLLFKGVRCLQKLRTFSLKNVSVTENDLPLELPDTIESVTLDCVKISKKCLKKMATSVRQLKSTVTFKINRSRTGKV